MQTTTVRALVPARVCLHSWTDADGGPTAQLWAFADTGEEMQISFGSVPMLTTHSATQEDLPDAERAEMLAAARLVSGGRGMRIELDVALPSGFGGPVPRVGATVRGVAQLFGADFHAQATDQLNPAQAAAVSAGAAVVGAAEHRSVALPSLHAVLVDPVNEQLPQGDITLNAAELPSVPSWSEDREFVAWLAAEAASPASNETWPEIDEAIDEIALLPGCLLARVSGHGPGCFGLFPDAATAQGAASHIAALKPLWWVQPAHLT